MRAQVRGRAHDETAELGSAKRKGWSRESRARIVDAATALFASNGYTETTIDRIGAAVGLTGPAIYRHFRSKSELLGVVMEQAARPAWDETCRLRESGGDPRDIFRGVIAAWVEQSVLRRALMSVYVQQHRSLDDAMRRRVRGHYRELTGVWVDLLGRIHPALSMPERATMVDSAMWLLRSPAFFHSELPDERVTELLTRMVVGALSIDSPGASPTPM
jgi:AcrR family transcriptional regulator